MKKTKKKILLYVIIIHIGNQHSQVQVNQLYIIMTIPLEQALIVVLFQIRAQALIMAKINSKVAQIFLQE